ncbi:hypothetical protein PM082_021760 [Marasmius tenuissimus]|nr:hypothetical protein PM082_021760 [Marasmius tenuissimus]
MMMRICEAPPSAQTGRPDIDFSLIIFPACATRGARLEANHARVDPLCVFDAYLVIVYSGGIMIVNNRFSDKDLPSAFPSMRRSKLVDGSTPNW